MTDPRQDEVERVARALCLNQGFDPPFVDGPAFRDSTRWQVALDDARAAIASMDPVRQVAMQLREALLELASEVGAAAMPAASLDRISGPLRKARSALASANAVLGEG